MALARALTKRIRAYEEATGAPIRAFSSHRKTENKSIDRTKISHPLELISSTNNLVFEAPDIPSGILDMSIDTDKYDSAPHALVESPNSSASSTKSYEDSMKSPGFSDASSRTSAEYTREPSPVVSPKNEKTFFMDLGENSPVFMKEEITESPVAEEQTPHIPQRAPSHTKKTHQTLARQRSQRLAGPPSPTRRSTPLGTRSSMEFLSEKPEADHPFGAELQKVSELVEEFNLKPITILDEDTQYLIDHGLQCLTADDYKSEIESLFAVAFPPPLTWL